MGEFYECKREKNAKDRKYYAENKEKIAARLKAHYQDNKEKLSRMRSIYAKKNPEIFKRAKHKRRALKKQNGGELSKGLTEKLMTLQQGKCAVCKVSVKNGHHLDHIFPLALGGTNEDSNIQILCPSCNCSKGAKHPQDFMNSRGFLL